MNNRDFLREALTEANATFDKIAPYALGASLALAVLYPLWSPLFEAPIVSAALSVIAVLFGFIIAAGVAAQVIRAFTKKGKDE